MQLAVPPKTAIGQYIYDEYSFWVQSYEKNLTFARTGGRNVRESEFLKRNGVFSTRPLRYS
jgi:hypothetical protein